MHSLSSPKALAFWSRVAPTCPRCSCTAGRDAMGWQLCGVIPGYALLPQGGLCATRYFYRTLSD